MPISIPIYFWYPILCTFGLGLMFMNIPPVTEQFMDLFGVKYGGLSFFLSAIFWSHSIVQVPAGIFIDRLGALRSLVLCICICAVFSLLPFLAPRSLALAAFSRFALGVGTGALFLVAVKISKILTPPNYITRVQGAQGAAFCLGTMVPYVILPYLGPYGWAASYLLGVVIAAVLALGILKLPRESLGKTSSEGSLGQVWGAVKVIAGSKGIWIIGACHGFAYGTLTTIGNWLPSILADTRPGTVTKDWAIATSIMLLVGTAGRAFGGELPRIAPRGSVIAKAVCLIGVLYLGLAFSHNPLPLIACALVLAFVCGGTYASVFTLTIDISAPIYVATAVGFMNMVANFVGVALTVLLGNVRDFTGGFSSGLMIAGGVALALWIFARRFLRDVEGR
ncbi:MAG: Hexuronate transporter [Desulfovibrio sp.]